jgi:hydrogenase maturation factor HypF (carbamoyltransferase family)
MAAKRGRGSTGAFPSEHQVITLLVSHHVHAANGAQIAEAAAGNDERVLAIFLDNLGRWHRGAPLLNEVLKNRQD